MSKSDIPFIFINSAMSADGKISTRKRKQVRISGALDFERVDILKASSDAVMVGIGTVLSDDPSLTVKSDERKRQRIESGKDENPVRIVVDSHARTPLDADILKKGKGQRIIAVSDAAPAKRVTELSRYARIITTGSEQVDLAKLMSILKDMGIERLMVEGGATLNWALIAAGLVDEIYTFVGNIVIGGTTAPTLADGCGFGERNEVCELRLIDTEVIEEGVLLRWAVSHNRSRV